MSNQPSEFEGRGVKRFGGFGLQEAWEKLRYAMRTGKDPQDPSADLNAEVGHFGDGGVTEDNWKNIRG